MTTTASALKHDLSMHGPLSLIARARWAPSSADIQTMTDSAGVKNVTRTSAGLYVVNLLPGFKAVNALVQRIDASVTLYQWHDVYAITTTAVTVRQRSKAFASVASAPTASDTCDQLEVLIWGRVAS